MSESNSQSSTAAANHDADAIVALAEARARDAGLAYRGAVTPAEAWALLSAGRALLIDVRTRAEHEYVGRVPGTGLIEWKRDGVVNPDFLADLARAGDPDTLFLFLCRSGVRSHAAALAATAAGFRGAINILEGFEGDLDEQQHRGTRGGWRKAGLPWIQG